MNEWMGPVLARIDIDVCDDDKEEGGGRKENLNRVRVRAFFGAAMVSVWVLEGGGGGGGMSDSPGRREKDGWTGTTGWGEGRQKSGKCTSSDLSHTHTHAHTARDVRCAA